MIVKCTNITINEKDKVYTNLTPHNEYIVLSIEFYNMEISTFSNYIGDYILYRIEDDEGFVKPLPSKLFTIVSSRLSRCWISYRENEECYSVLPREWAQPSFWEEFYNDECNAIEVFESVKNQIYAEEKCN